MGRQAKDKQTMGPAPWRSGQVPVLHFGGPGFCQFGSWTRTWHRSSGHAEAVSHMPQLEGPITGIYNYVLRGLWGEEGKKTKKDQQQMLAQVTIFKKKYIYIYI